MNRRRGARAETSIAVAIIIDFTMQFLTSHLLATNCSNHLNMRCDAFCSTLITAAYRRRRPFVFLFCFTLCRPFITCFLSAACVRAHMLWRA